MMMAVLMMMAVMMKINVCMYPMRRVEWLEGREDEW